MASSPKKPSAKKEAGLPSSSLLAAEIQELKRWLTPTPIPARLATESYEDYEKFLVYFRLGPGRTVDAAYRAWLLEQTRAGRGRHSPAIRREAIMQAKAPREWLEMAEKNRWEERTHRWERQERERTLKLRAMQGQVAYALLAESVPPLLTKALEALNTLEFDRPEIALNALNLGLKIMEKLGMTEQGTEKETEESIDIEVNIG